MDQVRAGKLQAPETGHHGNTVADKHSPYCGKVCGVFTQQYDSKMLVKAEEMQLLCEKTSYENL